MAIFDHNIDEFVPIVTCGLDVRRKPPLSNDVICGVGKWLFNFNKGPVDCSQALRHHGHSKKPMRRSSASVKSSLMYHDGPGGLLWLHRPA